MKMTQRQRYAKKVEMRDYRNRKRLMDFQIFLNLLKEKVDSGEVAMADELKEHLRHAIKVCAQI